MNIADVLIGLRTSAVHQLQQIHGVAIKHSTALVFTVWVFPTFFSCFASIIYSVQEISYSRQLLFMVVKSDSLHSRHLEGGEIHAF